MKFANILRRLYCEPWLITPAMHKTMSDVLRAHLAGATIAEKLFSPERDPDDVPSAPSYPTPGNIAVVQVHGIISQRLSSMEKMCAGGCDLLDVRAECDKAMQNPGIQGVLLHFSTPGGSVTGVPELADYIEHFPKPTVAFTDDSCASAGYWLASQCGAIVAAPSAQVGCIGVYQAFLDMSRAYEMKGFKMELFKTGKFKGMGIAGLPLTDEHRKYLQDGVNQVFAWFKSSILEQRPDISDDTMQGQCFYGEDALAAGLVDEVGDMARAVALLQEMIGNGDKQT